MSYNYENVPSSQVRKIKQHLYGRMINVLYLQEDNSPFVDATIQNIINEVGGLNLLFDYQSEILSIIGNLQTARQEPERLRACILTAANLVDKLKGGDGDV